MKTFEFNHRVLRQQEVANIDLERQFFGPPIDLGLYVISRGQPDARWFLLRQLNANPNAFGFQIGRAHPKGDKSRSIFTCTEFWLFTDNDRIEFNGPGPAMTLAQQLPDERELGRFFVNLDILKARLVGDLLRILKDKGITE
jgi:hypothetical protein